MIMHSTTIRMAQYKSYLPIIFAFQDGYNKPAIPRGHGGGYIDNWVNVHHFSSGKRIPENSQDGESREARKALLKTLATNQVNYCIKLMYI